MKRMEAERALVQLYAPEVLLPHCDRRAVGTSKREDGGVYEELNEMRVSGSLPAELNSAENSGKDEGTS